MEPLARKQSLSKAESAVATDPSAKPNAPRETENAPAAGAGEQPSPQATVTITATDGTATQVFADGFHEMRQFDKNLHLLSGQNVAFDKIKRIDVVTVYEESVKVRVVLTDNRVLEASLPAGSSTLGFHGENDLGAFEIRWEKIKRVVFPR